MLRFVTFWLNWISIEADVILTNRQWRETCEGPQWGWLVWFRKMSEQWGETLAANLPANDPAPPVTSARLGTLKIQTKRLVERIYFQFRDVVMQILVVWACGGSHADWTLWRRVEISVPSRKCRSALFFPWNKVYSSDLTDAIAATLTARGAAIVVVFFQSLLSLKWSHESQPASTSSRYSLVETERGFCLRTPKSAQRNHAAAC